MSCALVAHREQYHLLRTQIDTQKCVTEVHPTLSVCRRTNLYRVDFSLWTKLQAEVHVFVFYRYFSCYHNELLCIRLWLCHYSFVHQIDENKEPSLTCSFRLNFRRKICTALKTVAHTIISLHRHCKNVWFTWVNVMRLLWCHCHHIPYLSNFQFKCVSRLTFRCNDSASLDNVKQRKKQRKKRCEEEEEEKNWQRSTYTCIDGGCVVAVVHKTQTDLFAYIIISWIFIAHDLQYAFVCAFSAIFCYCSVIAIALSLLALLVLLLFRLLFI